MSSDTRYIYNHQSSIAQNYDYGAYPPPSQQSPYDTPTSARPIRQAPPPSTQPPSTSTSPHQAYPPTPSHAYPPPSQYSSTSYVPQHQQPPPPPPQWTADGWSHYTHPPPQPPQAYGHPSSHPQASQPPPPIHHSHPSQQSQQQQQHQQHQQHQTPHHQQPQQTMHAAPTAAYDSSLHSQVPSNDASRGYAQPPAPPARPPQNHGEGRERSGLGTNVSPANQSQSQPSSRRQEKDSPSLGTSVATAPSAVPPATLDFTRMFYSYRQIMDDANSLSSSAVAAGDRLPSSEYLERMVQSATQGAQTLNTIRLAVEASTGTTISPPAVADPAVTRQPQRDEDVKQNGSGKQKTEDKANNGAPATNQGASSGGANTTNSGSGGGSGSGGHEGQTCLGCKATSTPEWRRGPMGPRTLCNACGLVYAKIIKRRVREEASGKKNGNGEAAHGSQSQLDGDSDSDDDGDEYDSQSRRSDGDGHD